MNRGPERLFQPPLRDHEAAVLENAVRLAVDSVINVLCSVNGARSREYRRMVEDRDREIRRLEGRLTELERELRLLRRRGCSCGLLEARSSEEPGGGDPGGSDPEGGDPACGDPACGDQDAAAARQDCEMRISLGLFGSPPSLVSPHSLESAAPSPPGRPVLDRSSEASGASGAPDACGAAVKEESCELDAVLIKWEMSEDGAAGGRSPGSVPGGRKPLDSSQRTTFREKPRDPGGPQTSEGDHLRNRKRGVPTSQLPEEAQRIKRAAWRAASRRYYARKVARQQAAYPRPLPRLTNCPLPQPPPPPDAWSSNRRLYSQEAPPPPYGLLLDGALPPGEQQDAGGGGIMCS
ncbi:uncharacterized protein LOC115397360 [Salarias fasciatus]|uniref:uncharacterized protein LOC115397360 n=1 Tax=Salarias fasciatus TaxID=181472 RepID=UPI001176F70E|nr:uncharacterized protein LOC115397360 [Salarias fasciatus]